MKTFTTMKSWIVEEDSRLGARTYAEGGLAARNKVVKGTWKWQRLDSIASVFRGPLHKRIFVRDPMHGIPYLAASDVSRADLPRDMLLSLALTPELPVLRIEPNWLLISSAGTIGQVTFVREELAEFAISQDMLRVASYGAVLPGYLFAFLSSSSGQALVRMRTYGSVVDRIEPQHIADMPVPIPDDAFQERIHGLVTRAAEARTEASRLLDEASGYFDTLAGPMPSSHDHAYAVGVVRRSDLNYRLDAFNHVGWATEARFSGVPLGALGRVSRPGIVKRIFVQRGVPFISGIDAFQIRPDFRQQIMRAEAERGGDLVMEGQILIQRSGQRYGLIGRPAYVAKHMDGWAASEHLMRVSLYDASMRGPVFAFFRSDAGRRALMRSSYGTSIPELNPEVLAAVQIPSLPESLAIGANRALELREEAFKAEEQAIREVEAWVG